MLLLSIDPGRDKCGVALVRGGDGVTVLQQEIVPTNALGMHLTALGASGVVLDTVIVGGGTNSASVVATVREAFPGTALTVVGEAYTTQRARERFLREHPARGWRRLLPRGLQTPGRAVDDFVAIILAEDYLAAQTRTES